ncbi:hypothetical protein [Labilibacter marinus]|uniref:hypothetical protein n=1 Tax=Labilibacter marinus TaxID=1477105 RepID=UPI0009502F67|nr:hypothetical protein [Labilibacter marinus]
MENLTTSTNVSFSFLKGSSEFLNIILDNINSCVLLLNNKMELVSFNDAIKTLFPLSRQSDLKFIKCGEAIGCAHQVDEQTECGSTTKCRDCELRISALSSYINDSVTQFKKIERPFYNESGEKINIKLQYSTRLFPFETEKYIIMVLESLPYDKTQEKEALNTH